MLPYYAVFHPKHHPTPTTNTNPQHQPPIPPTPKPEPQPPLILFDDEADWNVSIQTGTTILQLMSSRIRYCQPLFYWLLRADYANVERDITVVKRVIRHILVQGFAKLPSNYVISWGASIRNSDHHSTVMHLSQRKIHVRTWNHGTLYIFFKKKTACYRK